MPSPSRPAFPAFLLVWLVPAAVFGQRFDLGQELHVPGAAALAPGPLWIPPVNPLYDNGPLVNHPGRGFEGADESALQTSTLDLVVLGFACHPSFKARIADEFVVPHGEIWHLERLTVFTYQTGIVTAPTTTGITLRVWRGRPLEDGSEIIFGDTTTNRLVSSAWTGAYRVFEHLSGIAHDRAVMANLVDLPLDLPAGEYWLDFQATGSLLSGPWCPPVTLPEKALTGNALSSIDNGKSYQLADDPGPDTGQGIPFLLEGERRPESLEVPTLGRWGDVGLVVLLASAGTLVLRRRGTYS